MSHAQAANDLGKQMGSLHIHTALIISSQELDELPSWSPDGRFLAGNVAGKWVKVDVSAVQLQQAKWHRQLIGVAKNATLQPMTDEEVHTWAKFDKSPHPDHDAVTTGSGLKVEMRHNDLSSALVVSRGKRESVVWQSGLENCFALTLSPNKKYVAYVCELNGILVMDPEKAFEGTVGTLEARF